MEISLYFERICTPTDTNDGEGQSQGPFQNVGQGIFSNLAGGPGM